MKDVYYQPVSSLKKVDDLNVLDEQVAYREYLMNRIFVDEYYKNILKLEISTIKSYINTKSLYG